MTNDYTIPAWNLGYLTERVDRLNKRCKRIGIAPITLTSAPAYREHEYRTQTQLAGDEAPRTKWIKEGDDPSPHHGATGRVREWLTVTVTGETPRYDGWALIGVLEPIHTDDGSENIIQAVPGHAVPAEYRNRVGKCDHCHTRRQRAQTFVVQHEDGRTKMVGRQCLRDFLGHVDPHALAAAAEMLCALGQLCSDAGDADWMGGGQRQRDAYDLEHFLIVTAAVIRHDGWLGRGKAREIADSTGRVVMATADRVALYHNPTVPTYRTHDEQQWLDEVKELVEAERAQQTASDTAEWALGIARDAADDYLYNLNLIARAGYVTDKTLGLAASMVVAYRRANGLAMDGKIREPLPESNHVGTIKQRAEFTLTCKRIFESNGNYGVTGIHALTDAAGNDLVWFASESAKWLEEGKTYRVKATVTAHGERNGRKQTTINRLAIVEELVAA